MQIPQMLRVSKPALPVRSSEVLRQSRAEKNSSRSLPQTQFFPWGAPPGQISTQTRQFPQRDWSIGSSAMNGASVRTEVSRTALPNVRVMRRAFFPIHPRPARVATVLWGSAVRKSGEASPWWAKG